MNENDFMEVLSPGELYRRRQERPWYLKLRYRVTGWWHYKRPRPVSRIRQDWQRSQRGFSASDLWSMDDYICQLLGEMTAEMRRTCHGHPCNPDGKYTSCGSMPDGDPCGCEQDWNDTLDAISQPLLAYKTHWEYPDGETSDQHAEREKRLVADAQQALRKLAGVLPSLWD